MGECVGMQVVVVHQYQTSILQHAAEMMTAGWFPAGFHRNGVRKHSSILPDVPCGSTAMQKAVDETHQSRMTLVH